MSWECIIFDLDGTLTEPEEGITKSIQYALLKMGIAVSDRTSLCKYIGPPLLPAFQQDFGMTEEESRQALAFYRERFIQKGMYENKVYDGVIQMLADLKKAGKKILLATTKPEPQATAILEHFKLIEYFDVTAGADLQENVVEKPDVMQLAFSRLPDANKSNTVMVGDRKYDVAGAKVHGILSVGVLYGHGDEEELKTAGVDYIVGSVAELHKLLLQ